jgi:hypothetical protein
MDRKRPNLSRQSLNAAFPGRESSLFLGAPHFDSKPDPPRRKTIFFNGRIVRGEKPRPLFRTMR